MSLVHTIVFKKRGDLHMWINNVALDDLNHEKEMPNVMILLRKMHAMAAELKKECQGNFDWKVTQTQLTMYPGKVRFYVFAFFFFF
jgi:hypothetical protein